MSADTPYVHLAWKEKEKELASVKYLMGSDAPGRLGRLFGVWDEEQGLHLRGTFLIAPDGKLMNAEVNFFNLGRNIEELMRKLKANIYLGRKKTEACPSKWREEGDKTLRPNPKLVGRVHEALQAEDRESPKEAEKVS